MQAVQGICLGLRGLAAVHGARNPYLTKRVHIHSYYGIRVPKTIVGMVFGDLIP